jgi:hypothetical protein
MTGERIYDTGELFEQLIARAWAPLVADLDPPTRYTELAEWLWPRLDDARITYWLRANMRANLQRRSDRRANFADAPRFPVPTPQELSEADAELRARVLPEVPEEALQQAVEKISADPERLKLAAFLADALQRAASISPTPWLVFVLVFWVAMKMNPDEVGALALAYAVMGSVKPDGE